jgi:hypothetical protein
VNVRAHQNGLLSFYAGVTRDGSVRRTPRCRTPHALRTLSCVDQKSEAVQQCAIVIDDRDPNDHDADYAAGGQKRKRILMRLSRARRAMCSHVFRRWCAALESRSRVGSQFAQQAREHLLVRVVFLSLSGSLNMPRPADVGRPRCGRIHDGVVGADRKQHDDGVLLR